ncbi:uncharacterized protein LOC116341117 isoform X3 [Contarinia nasturtii]|uniref:uncharacterized protein LOC116341117 isoform X3 n=1 Tax=Contarinia nasturtii TaxID=265458 RepID=UPI0012D492E8|nr:uncharacterized protein LOC116341117 isoform X3 [Contarinia nasturtii]
MRGSTAGLTEGTVESRHSIYDAFLVLLDVLFSSVIAAPVVIAYWRGAWNLMQYIFYPHNPTASALVTTFIGIIGHFIFFYCQNWLSRTFNPDKHRLTFMIVSRIYTAIYGFVCISAWRGPWALLDLYSESRIWTLIIVTVICIVLLVFCKGLRNISSTPFGVSTDHSKDYFVTPTMFKSSASKEPAFYFIDCAFSVIVIGTLVVLVWRSLWVIFDLLIFPREQTLSAWYSLAIGYGIVAITFALQPLMKLACDRLTGLWRIAACDAFLFFSFVGTVNVWRGVWQLLDLHLFPENPVMSNLLCHGVSFFFLAMLNCSNSVLVRGVFIDAEEPMGQCVIFPVYYIRLFVQKERTKKQRRILDALEKGDLQTELLEKSEKNTPKIVKSSAKSIEMTNMANIKPTKIENGYEKENYPNGEHKIGQ